MRKKRMTLAVRGKRKIWSFEVLADPQYLKEWQADGLEIYILENTIPMWVVDMGLIRPWCFIQDLFNFKNPFRK